MRIGKRSIKWTMNNDRTVGILKRSFEIEISFAENQLIFRSEEWTQKRKTMAFTSVLNGERKKGTNDGLGK